MKRPWMLGIGLWLFGLLTALAAQAKTNDILDTAAMPSDLAGASLLLDIAALQQQVIAVGSRGQILYSTDSGTSWQQAQVPVRSDLTTVFIQGPELAFAAGHDGVILRSKDSGKTWQRLLDGRQLGALYQAHYQKLALQDPERYQLLLQDSELLIRQGADKAWLDLLFLDDKVGFAVGAFNLLLKTADGGDSWIPWSEHSVNPMGYHLHGITRRGNELWLAGEQGLLQKGTLQGTAFEPVELPYQGTFFGVTTLADEILVYGLRGHALLSEQQGQQWRELTIPTQASLTFAWAGQHQELYLSSQVGQLWRSTDLGRSFELLPQSNSLPVMALSGTADKLLLVGWRGLRSVNLADFAQRKP